MQVYIDDELVTETIESADTLDELLRQVQSRVCEPGRMVVSIRCDGQAIPGDEMTKTLAAPVETCERLDVYTGTRGALVADAMGQAAAALAGTETDARSAANLLSGGDMKGGIQALSRCVSVWQQIHEAVVKSVAMLDIDLAEMRVGEESLLAILSKPKDILQQIKEALQAQDHVLLSDLLQYELEQVTEQWHAAIGELRRAADEVA